MWAIALGVATIAAQASAAEGCTARELRHRFTATIDLKPVGGVLRKQPAYYFTGPSQRFVIFFDPKEVVAKVEESARQDASIRPALEAMQRDLPLAEDTDLFKYGLRNVAFAFHFKHLVANLLDAGLAMVDRMSFHDPARIPPDINDSDPAYIKRVDWATRGAEGRKYCDPLGLELLDVVDLIAD